MKLNLKVNVKANAKGKIKAVAAIAVLAGWAFSTSASAEPLKTIRIGTDSTYPPFESLAKNGDIVGFDVDLGNALCEKLHAKCVWITSSFDGLIPGLEARKFDMVMSSMAATPKRREQIDFTDRLYRNQTRMIARDGTGLMPDVAQLVHKRIGVEQGTVQETYAKAKWVPAGVEVSSYQTMDQAYVDLENGRVDAILVDAVQGELGFLNTPKGKGFAFAGDVIYDRAIMGDGDAVGLRKGDTALRDALNGAIADILKDGTYKQIESKYFAFDMYGK